MLIENGQGKVQTTNLNLGATKVVVGKKILLPCGSAGSSPAPGTRSLVIT